MTLKDASAIVSFSVDDLNQAKEFYGQVLGLEVDDSQGVLMLKLANNYGAMVYPKANHEPAVYTLLNFTVDDLAATMKDLQGKGVKFEHYDLPDIKTDSEGVVDYGMMKIAFFNDPAGNNHAVLQMTP